MSSENITRPIPQTEAYLGTLELLIVAGLAFASMVSGRLLPLAALSAGAFWLIRVVGYRRLWMHTPADWPIILLLVWLPVTLWATAQPEVTYPQVYRLLSGIGLYYAIVHWAVSPLRLRILIAGAVGAGFLLACATPFIVPRPETMLPGFPAALYDRFDLLVSDTVNANVMAGALTLIAPIPIAILLFNWRRSNWLVRLGAFSSTLVICGMLVITQSRGGLMGLAAALLVMAILYSRSGWLLLLVTLAGASLAVRLVGTSVFLTPVAADGAIVGGLAERIQIWSRAILVVRDFPGTGIGIGAFEQVVDVLYPFTSITIDVPHAHNLLLQIAVDLGLPGLIAWLAILLTVLATLWQVYRATRGSTNRLATGIAVGVCCSQVALLVHGLTDAVTWGMVRTAVLPWAIWGLAIACRSVYVTSSSPQKGEELVDAA